MPTTGRPMGRPPKPTELKRALGNPGKRRLPPVRAPGDTYTGVPPVPSDLAQDGRAAWERYWDAGRSHLSPRADYGLMHRLCQSLDERAGLRAWLAEDYYHRAWYSMANGQQVTHPSIKRIESIDSQTTAWLSQLGFSPADRARLGLLEVHTPDELDDFRKRRDERTG